MPLILSAFCQRVTSPDSVIYKNHRTGAVARLTPVQQNLFGVWLQKQSLNPPVFITNMRENGFLVEEGTDEFQEWQQELEDTRNNKAHIFTLHFEPTIQCQMACSYCFENGANRGSGMKESVLKESLVWLKKYFQTHREVDALRLVFFGGEPLLRKDIVSKAVSGFSQLTKEMSCDFWSEIITNGELLDPNIAATLQTNSWRRIQITLDGPRHIHDRRRSGKGGRPTFDKIIENIQMILRGGFISHADVRMTFDNETRDALPELVEYLASLDCAQKIKLSLGIVTPYLGSAVSKHALETETARKALAVWGAAKQFGFIVPEEFISGPLCVALAKHSAVLQPDGGLQKCFCTSGRKEYDFGTVFVQPESYTKDHRYENFRRTSQCIDEKCQFLPICGGGCTYHAHVQSGNDAGFHERFCQKTLLSEMNEGLLRLNY